MRKSGLLWVPVTTVLLLIWTALLSVEGLPFPSVSLGNASWLTQDLKQRRADLMATLGRDALVVLFSAEPKRFEGDVDYEYRQDNNLFYLTGIDQPETTLVLAPGSQTAKEILFLAPRDPVRELWTGARLSEEEAKFISGVETVYPAPDFEAFIDSVLNGKSPRLPSGKTHEDVRPFIEAMRKGTAVVYAALTDAPGTAHTVTPARAFADRVKKKVPGLTVSDASGPLHRMRLTKSDYEIAQHRRAIDITCQAQREAMQTVRPGLFEYEVEAVIEFVFRKNGARWPGFPSIVASGGNAMTLHYDRSTRKMIDGDLLLTDVGAEVNYYAADVTRTYPVNGRFTAEQAELYSLVLKAQVEAMKVVRPGGSIMEVHTRAVDVLKEGLLELGLITSTEDQQYRYWYPHMTSHWLGMNVHDVGGRGVTFEPGMVLTVEPGLYIRSDSFERMKSENPRQASAVADAMAKYSGIGIRIEDDVLITATGCEVLSRMAPKTISEIESWQAKR